MMVLFLCKGLHLTVYIATSKNFAEHCNEPPYARTWLYSALVMLIKGAIYEESLSPYPTVESMEGTHYMPLEPEPAVDEPKGIGHNASLLQFLLFTSTRFYLVREASVRKQCVLSFYVEYARRNPNRKLQFSEVLH